MFVELCNNDDSFSDEDLGKIMNYVIQRYTNMRGTYFVKHLRGTDGGGINRLVGLQATRDKVKTAVACSKAAGEAKKKTEMMLRRRLKKSKRSRFGMMRQIAFLSTMTKNWPMKMYFFDKIIFSMDK